MRRKIFILLAAALISAFMAAGTLYAAECSGGGAPLEIVNKSGREITGLFLSQTGRESWSPNRLSGPLAAGASASCDIGRDGILGLSDLKLTLKEGGKIIWRRLPILEIFSITADDKLEPRYERIKLGS
ncbi:hypothetical protein [Cloacibacillus evryensis]